MDQKQFKSCAKPKGVSINKIINCGLFSKEKITFIKDNGQICESRKRDFKTL